MQKNALFILIDSLRYDVVSDPEAMRAIAPNIARIAEHGFAAKVIANAQATQFVMPSLFSLTYPLDYGGYNNGIRERPASFVECLAKAGYSTNLFAACSQMGISLSYDRGFDSVHSAVDYRHILSYRIEKTLQYEFDLVSRSEKSESEALSVIAPELDAILETIPRDVAASDSRSWPRRLKRINSQIATLCDEERKLLRESPQRVMQKLRSLRPSVYWRSLGRTEFGAWERFRWRAATAINWRFRALAVKFRFPVFPLGHFQVLAKELCPSICAMMTRAHRPWFKYVHFMDVHDNAALNRPLHLLSRIKYWPRWKRAQRNGQTTRRFLYDSALMYVDAQLGRLIDALEKSDQLEETVILITGDHGNAGANSPRRGKKELGHRTHFEDIDVGLVVSHGTPGDKGLLDSMGVTATLLELLDVQPHGSFLGQSILGSGRDAVISENAGRGNGDVARRDLYFTITSERYKLMAILKGNEIVCSELYDLELDPLELNNRVDEPDMHAAKKSLLRALYRERQALLSFRGVTATDADLNATRPKQAIV